MDLTDAEDIKKRWQEYTETLYKKDLHEHWLQDWKRWVFIAVPKKGNAKECSNYCTIALISYASKVMLKILQARLQQYMNCNFWMFKLDLEKVEELEIKLPRTFGL